MIQRTRKATINLIGGLPSFLHRIRPSLTTSKRMPTSRTIAILIASPLATKTQVEDAYP